MGIIDTLSAGFGVVNRRPYAVVVPVFLDLFLWLGPRLSLAPVVDRFLGLYAQFVADYGVEVAGQYRLDPAQLAETTTRLRQMGEAASGWNLFGTVAWMMPSLVIARASQAPGHLARPAAAEVASAGSLLIILLGLFLGGLAIAAFYNAMVAQAVRYESRELARLPFWLNVARGLVRFAALLLLAVSFAVLVVFPAAMVIGMIGLVSSGLAGFLVSLLSVMALLAAFYLFFVNDAIFLGHAGPWRAVVQSVRLVHRHFWGALGLVALIELVVVGWPLAWSMVYGHPVGTVVAIVGNGYIASGLSAASMIFYRDRVLMPRVEGAGVRERA